METTNIDFTTNETSNSAKRIDIPINYTNITPPPLMYDGTITTNPKNPSCDITVTVNTDFIKDYTNQNETITQLGNQLKELIELQKPHEGMLTSVFKKIKGSLSNLSVYYFGTNQE